jgi:hypothetical protein
MSELYTNQDSSVARFRVGRPGFDFHKVTDFFSSTARPHRLWTLLNLLFNGYRRLSPGVRRLGREADNSAPSSAEVKNEWSYISTLPHLFVAWYLNTGYVFMVWYLVKHRDTLHSMQPVP